jgi:3-phytase
VGSRLRAQRARREATPALCGAFRIALNPAAGIDSVSETDGLKVLPGALGPAFPQRLLLVQDSHKRLTAGPQNFQLVSWEDVAAALKLP